MPPIDCPNTALLEEVEALEAASRKALKDAIANSLRAIVVSQIVLILAVIGSTIGAVLVLRR